MSVLHVVFINFFLTTTTYAGLESCQSRFGSRLVEINSLSTDRKIDLLDKLIGAEVQVEFKNFDQLKTSTVVAGVLSSGQIKASALIQSVVEREITSVVPTIVNGVLKNSPKQYIVYENVANTLSRDGFGYMVTHFDQDRKIEEPFFADKLLSIRIQPPSVAVGIKSGTMKFTDLINFFSKNILTAHLSYDETWINSHGDQYFKSLGIYENELKLKFTIFSRKVDSTVRIHRLEFSSQMEFKKFIDYFGEGLFDRHFKVYPAEDY